MKKQISPSNNLKNLNLIINSDTYKLAHEDIGLLRRNEMRGVRTVSYTHLRAHETAYHLV